MAVQYRPDVFVGALAFAGGGSGVIAAWLGKSDAVWALKMLVDPSAPLAISGLPDIPPGATYGPNYQQDVALGQLVTKARATDAGMARLVLAAAFEQAPGWPTGAVEPAADDYLTQGNLIASQFAFGNPQFVHKEIEVMAGGAMTWNHGVDYRDLLARSGLDRARSLVVREGGPRPRRRPRRARRRAALLRRARRGGARRGHRDVQRADRRAGAERQDDRRPCRPGGSRRGVRSDVRGGRDGRHAADGLHPPQRAQQPVAA